MKTCLLTCSFVLVMVLSESSSFMVPEHLVETILVKLPVKSLVRFKLLSKNFRDLMDSSRFVATHLQASSLVHLQKRSTVLLTVHDYPQGIRQDRMLMLSEENGHVHHKEEQLPTFASDGDGRHQPCDIHYIDLLGSQNGLICLCLHYTMIRNNNNYYNNKKIVLWNPATRQSRILPPPPPPSLSRVCGVVDLGFAYNHDKDDYMVSGIVGMIDDDTATNHMCYQVDIFSMRHWGWETYIYRHELASNVPSGCMSSLGPSHSATLKGIIYRVVSVVLADGTCDNFVLSMDVKNIAFNRIELPETKDCWVSNLMVYSEGEGKSPSLGLFSNVGREEDGLSCFKCNVWVMKRNHANCLWRMMFTISIHHPASIDHPMGSWGDGRIIIRRTVAREGYSQSTRRRVAGNDLLVYEHHSSEGLMRNLPIGNADFVSLNACSYVESLVSLYHR